MVAVTVEVRGIDFNGLCFEVVMFNVKLMVMARVK